MAEPRLYYYYHHHHYYQRMSTRHPVRCRLHPVGNLSGSTQHSEGPQPHFQDEETQSQRFTTLLKTKEWKGTSQNLDPAPASCQCCPKSS